MDILKEIDNVKNHYENPITVTTYEGDDNVSAEYEYNTQREIAFITFMSASKYISGDHDELGKKPFYNIVNQIVDLEVRATDIDTKDIILRHTSPEFEIQALLATKAMHNIFNDMNFGETLNEYGEILSRYGNVLFKRSYDSDGELKISIVNWLTIAFDQFDIEHGVKIETHDMGILDLQKKRGVWNDDVIDEAIEEMKSSQLDSTKETIKSVEILEVEGEFERSVFTENENTTGASLQHYFVYRKGTDGNVVLFKEELKESNYIYDGRKKRLGVAWNWGVVEEGKESQGEVNLLRIYERRALEIKALGLNVTDDKELEDLNTLSDKQRGDTIFLNKGNTFKPLDLSNMNMAEFSNSAMSWQDNYKATMSAFDSVTGEETTSGLSYRLGLLQAKQASSIFDYRREKKGICIGQKVVKKWVLPEVFKKINRDFILEAGFSAEEIDMMHERYALSIANKKVIEKLEKGLELDKLSYADMIQEVRDSLPKKDIQFIDIKKGYFKDAMKNIRIDITGEEENVEAKIETLNSLLQIAQQDQTGEVFGKDGIKNIVAEITRLAGISKLEYGIGSPKGKGNLAPELSEVNTIQANGQGNSQVLPE